MSPLCTCIQLKDTETLKKSIMSSLVSSTLIGYLQLNQGSYGYYTITLLKFPYMNTCNITALMFFVVCFSFVQQVLNVHILCQKLQVFRYEQSARCCSALACMITTMLVELPFSAFTVWIFSTIIYFMSDMNKGYYNYFFFCGTLAMVGRT
jgi:ABC-2 type transporter